jgi:Ca2+-binding EF-hand superfamily protein
VAPLVRPASFLRESAWNWLDGLVVLTGWIEIIAGDSLKQLSVLRVARLMRPLRTISAVPAMKTLVGTLMDPSTISKLANVVLLILLLLTVCAIIAVNLFKAKLRSVCFGADPADIVGYFQASDRPCNLELHNEVWDGHEEPQPGETGLWKPQIGGCEMGEVCRAADPITGLPLPSLDADLVNFDNFGQAMFTIAVMITLEGWSGVMYHTQAGTGAGGSWLFFVLLICIGTFVIMNLFLAVISMGYEEQCERDYEDGKLTADAREFLQLLRTQLQLQIKAEPSPEEMEYLGWTPSNNPLSPRSTRQNMDASKAASAPTISDFHTGAASPCPHSGGKARALDNRKFVDLRADYPHVAPRLLQLRLETLAGMFASDLDHLARDVSSASDNDHSESEHSEACSDEFADTDGDASTTGELYSVSSGGGQWGGSLDRMASSIYSPMTISRWADGLFSLRAAHEQHREGVNKDRLVVGGMPKELGRVARFFKKQWDTFDVDGSGTLAYEEAVAVMVTSGIPHLDREARLAMFEEMDADGSGEVDMPEFVSWWADHAEEYGLAMREADAYGVLPTPFDASHTGEDGVTAQHLLHVLTNREARGHDKRWREDMLERMLAVLEYENERPADKKPWAPLLDVELRSAAQAPAQQWDRDASMNSLESVPVTQMSMPRAKRQLSVERAAELLATLPPKELTPQAKVSSEELTPVALRGKSWVAVLRMFARWLVEQPQFNVGVSVVVLINCIVLACERHGICDGPTKDEGGDSCTQERLLILINLVCTVLFAIEMVTKLIGLGLRGYWADYFNRFDGSLVLFSLVELIMPSGLLPLSVFRALRIFRILKLSSSLDNLRRVIVTIMTVLPQLGHFAFLMLIFVFFYACLGLHLFGSCTCAPPPSSVGEFPKECTCCEAGQQECSAAAALGSPEYNKWSQPQRLQTTDGEPSLAHFHSFTWSMLTVMQVLTGEDWNAVMYAVMATHGEFVGGFYFGSMMLLGTYMLLNLFLAVLILKTMEAFNPQAAPLRRAVERYERQLATAAEMARDMTESVERQQHHDSLQDEMRVDGVALCIFSKRSNLRRQLWELLTSKRFDSSILLCIVLSSFSLALEQPGRYHTNLANVLEVGDYTFTAVFTVELILKVLCLGLLCESPHAYLRSPWNVLDAMIVVCAILSLVVSAVMTEGDSSLSSLRTFRVFRALRPLRVIKRIPELKQVVESLFRAVPTLFNVVLVLCIFWLIFGILAVQVFAGKFYSCNDITGPEWVHWHEDHPHSVRGVVSEEQCSGSFTDDEGQLATRQWTNMRANFDHIGQSVLTLFEVSTLEMWLDIMHASIDAREVGYSPMPGHRVLASSFYVAFIIFGSFFMMQLLTGAIVAEYNKLNDAKGGTAFQSARQKRLVTRLVMRHKAERLVPSSPYKQKLLSLVMHQTFVNFMSAMIALNVVVMAFVSADMSDEFTDFLELLNDIFTWLFFAEAAIKLLCMGFKGYFDDGWNRYDFLVVVVTVFEFWVRHLQSSDQAGELSSVELLRTFRVFRLFRLFARLEKLMALVLTVVNALPTMLNVGGLLLLIFFIYAVLSMHLLGEVRPLPDAEYLDQFANFRTFPVALLTTFRMATGESWNGIMHDVLAAGDAHNGHGNCDNENGAQYCAAVPSATVPQHLDQHGSPLPACPEGTPEALEAAGTGEPVLVVGDCVSQLVVIVLFVSFQLVGQFVMLNLFIAVVLEHYKKATDKVEPVLQDADFETFRHTWNALVGADPNSTRSTTPGSSGYKLLPVELFDELMTALPLHIGWNKKERGHSLGQGGSLPAKIAAMEHSLATLPTRSLRCLVPHWHPGATPTQWPPTIIGPQQSPPQSLGAGLDGAGAAGVGGADRPRTSTLMSALAAANDGSSYLPHSTTSTATMELHYYHFCEVWLGAASVASFVAAVLTDIYLCPSVLVTKY